MAHTAGKLTETLGRGVKMMSLNDEYIKKQRNSSDSSAPKNVGEAVGRGLERPCWRHLWWADRCCVRSVPNVQVKEGLKGAATGLLQGLVGLGVKPVAGALDMLTHTFQGIKNSANMFDKQKRFMRYRLPRFFSRGILARFSKREAEGPAFY